MTIETVNISFEGSNEDRGSPQVVIYNPGVLPPALTSQVLRFGLRNAPRHQPFLTGILKGSREGFMGMIQSYGVRVVIVPVVVPQPWVS